MLFVLLFGLVSNGLITPVHAADRNQETVAVFGDESTGVLLEETIFNSTDKMTAFEALLNTVGSTNLEYSESEYGKMITGIKGLQAKGNFYWAFYINGISAQVGADQYIVQKGDQISFRYVDWTEATDKNVSIKVIGNKGILKEVTNIAFFDEPTAFEVLRVVWGDNLEVTDTQYGKMINAIGGLKAEGTYYWAFYVNGQMATIGADSYKLKAGDQISFSYESWETPEEEPNENETSPETNPIPAEAISATQLKEAVDAVSEYSLLNYVGEWEAVALKQAGKEVPKDYLKNVTKLVKDRQGKFSKITDYERYSLGILAAGGDPTDVSGYNLIEAIYSGNLTKQGLNGVFYGLITLDSSNFDIPEDAKWTREKLVSYLIEEQNKDMGWSWDGSNKSDIDTTAMVITALAPYKEQVEVKSSIDGAVQYLSSQYQNNKIDNSSTAAQVVIALSSIGVDANSSLFLKDDTSLIKYLLTFQNADGGFDWQGGNVSDVMSTSQGIQGIVAYHLLLNNKGPLYQLPLNPVDLLPEEPNNDNSVTTSPNHVENSNDGEVGLPLPNTGTNTYNYFFIGLLLMLIGTAFWKIEKRKKA